MGPLPKRRHSTGRKGRRRSQDTLKTVQIAHIKTPMHKTSLIAKLKKALQPATKNA